MKKTIIVVLSLLSCSPKPRLAAGAPSSAPGPGFVNLTWSTTGAAAVCNGLPGVLLDGGAATLVSDPVIMGGYVSQAASSISFFCTVQAFGAQEDYFAAQYSNDGNIWAPATQSNTAAATQLSLIDGGVGDGGLPGWIILGPTPVAYSDIALTHLAAMTYDAGSFCDAGPQGPSIIGVCDAGLYASYIDSGVNFCDGGHFCDAGPDIWMNSFAVCLTCNAVTVPR